MSEKVDFINQVAKDGSSFNGLVFPGTTELDKLDLVDAMLREEYLRALINQPIAGQILLTEGSTELQHFNPRGIGLNSPFILGQSNLESQPPRRLISLHHVFSLYLGSGNKLEIGLGAESNQFPQRANKEYYKGLVEAVDRLHKAGYLKIQWSQAKRAQIHSKNIYRYAEEQFRSSEAVKTALLNIALSR